MPDSATLLTPEATADEITESVLAKLEESANPTETENPEQQSEASETSKTESEPIEQESAEQAAPKYKVKVRGEELEVPLDELLNGYSRLEDYKAKTAEVAEERKAVAALREQQLTAIQQTLAMAQNFDPILAEGQRTDWALLAQTDPTGYVQKRAAFEGRISEVQRMQAEQERLSMERTNSFLAEQNKSLTEKLPEWATDEGKKAINKTVSSYLSDVGFSTDEIAKLADHRVLMVALEAAKYRELQAAQKTVADKKVSPAVPKTQKPSASNDGRTKDAKIQTLQKQAKRTGRDGDIIAAVLASI